VPFSQTSINHKGGFVQNAACGVGLNKTN